VLSRLFFLLVCVWLVPLPLNRAQTNVISRLPFTTRADMIANAKRFAEHTWTCQASNVRAPCIKNYDSNWKPGQRVKGVPYSWGGVDRPEVFDQKLAKGMAAGSHSRHGISSCTAGIDCSGFIATCWGLTSHAYSTSNLRIIAGKPKYNWFTDMKPGDVLNKAGSHVVLFAGYNRDGSINVYEAAGSAARVVFLRTTWSKFKGYIPLQYKAIADE
jgi:hypothetical protein